MTTTVESAAKAFGPGIGGPAYAWAIGLERLPRPWPTQSGVYFACFSLLLLVVAGGAASLPSDIDTAAKPATAGDTAPMAPAAPMDVGQRPSCSTVEVEAPGHGTTAACRRGDSSPRVSVRWAGRGNRTRFERFEDEDL